MVATKTVLKFFKYIGICLLTTGCTVKSDQMRFITNTDNQDTQALLPYTWTLEFGAYKSTVYAIEIGEMIILSNSLGDTVVLENYELKEIHRLGLYRHFWQIISGIDLNRIYKQGQYIGAFRCNDWLETTSQHVEKSQKKLSVFKQLCRAENSDLTQNIIRLDEQGYVRYMEFYLMGEEHQVKLKKS